MKLFIPSFVLAAILTSGFVPSAMAADKPSDLNCRHAGKTLLSKHTGQPRSTIQFFNGAALGDGAVSMEILLFTVHPDHAELIYKVEMNAEDCSLRNIEQLDID